MNCMHTPVGLLVRLNRHMSSQVLVRLRTHTLYTYTTSMSYLVLVLYKERHMHTTYDMCHSHTVNRLREICYVRKPEITTALLSL